MEITNVYDLHQNMKTILLEKGVNPAFDDNPAFTLSALAMAKNQITGMNMGEMGKSIPVTVSEQGFSFRYQNGDDKYSMAISIDKDQPDAFDIITAHEGKDGIFNKKEKDCTKITIERNEDNQITIKQFYGKANEQETMQNKCQVQSNYSSAQYDPYGIMHQYVNKRLMDSVLRCSFVAAQVGDILFTAQRAENELLLDSQVIETTSIKRDKLDTAYCTIQNGNGITQYRSMIPLNQEHGLREMYITNHILEDDVLIGPKSEMEVNLMIQKEENPKVQQGLRHYTQGREHYFYDSKIDSNHINVSRATNTTSIQK